MKPNKPTIKPSNHQTLLSFLLLIFYTFQLLSAQTVTISNVYNESNSPLPSNTIRCIAIDHNNTKWIGTDNGLTAFDGTNWTVYQSTTSPLPDDQIRAIAVTPDNALWIGTFNGGITHFDGSTWTTYHTGNSQLPDNFVRSIALNAANNLWIGTAGGLAFFDGTNWEIFISTTEELLLNNVNTVQIDETGVAWVGTVNGGLVHLFGKDIGAFTAHNTDLPDNTILSIAIDNNNTKWLAMPFGGLANFMNSDLSDLNTHIDSDILPSNSLKTVVIRHNLPIVGTAADGLAVYLDDGAIALVNSTNSDLPDDHISHLAVENPQTVWVGTQTGGLVELFVDEMVGIESSTTTQQALQFYPNPCNGSLFLKTETLLPEKIQFFNVFGEMVMEVEEVSPMIDLSHLTGGLYMVGFFLKKETFVQKLIIAD